MWITRVPVAVAQSTFRCVFSGLSPVAMRLQVTVILSRILEDVLYASQFVS